jgi:hypothetical protein
MQSKQLILAMAFSVILTGMAFSQCTQSGTTSDNSDIYSNEEYVVDTTMQDGDTATQGSDTTNMPKDTGSQDGNADTSNTAPDTSNMDGSNGSDTGMQKSQDGDGDGTGSVTKIPSFDPSKIDSFPGRVLSIDTINSSEGNAELTVSLKTKEEDSVKVFLAPESYLKNLNLTLKNGDSITVVGSKASDSQNKTAIVASQVMKNGATYLLRDEKGVPFWPKNEE